jgi:hypothetical protein
MFLILMACTASTVTLSDTGTVTEPTTTTTTTDTGTGLDCGTITTWADGLTPSQELHVSPSGSDSAGDGTQSNPFSSLAHAASLATPGTAVRLHPGSYGNAYLHDLYGEQDAPIWIGGLPGKERPVILGASEGLHLSGGAWLVVQDLEIDGADDNGINFDDRGDYADPDALHHVVFRNLWIHDVGGDGNQDCLKLSGLNHFAVLDSSFQDCGSGSSGSGIDMVGCHHGMIASNDFQRTGANAVQAKGGTEDVELRWNHLVDAGDRGFNMGGSTGFVYFRPPLDPDAPNAEARDIRAVANLIEGSEASFAFVGCVDCSATNNTLLGPEKWLFRILQETTSTDAYEFLTAQGGTLTNNLVVFTRAAVTTDVNIGSGTDPDSFVFTNNLFYASDDPGRSAPTLPGTETGTLAGLDPLLDESARIDQDSPAAGAGVLVTDLGGDRAGVCYGEPPSIGAYEVPGG